jgi:hypothetical protein
LTAAPDALGGPVWQARFERDASPLAVGRGLGTWLVPSPPTHMSDVQQRIDNLVKGNPT